MAFRVSPSGRSSGKRVAARRDHGPLHCRAGNAVRRQEPDQQNRGRQNARDERELGTAHALPTPFAMIPGEHEDEEETGRYHDRRASY
jgi:hypothetical protein